MNKKTVFTMCCVIAGFAVFKWAIAGSLDPTAGPSDSGSAMYTLEDIYNRLTGNTTATKRSGGFTEPSAAPGATGHTLDEVYDVAIPTQVPKTGQTASIQTGDDGDLQKGVAWPSPRFTDNGDGTATDNLTNLVWLKNADCANAYMTWANAISYSNALYDGCTDCFSSGGDCGLNDGSVAGDWRVPNIKELLSLIDYGQRNPALPSSYPFTNVRSPGFTPHVDGRLYWASTHQDGYASAHWGIDMYYGQVLTTVDGLSFYTWPVRDKK